jgi:hypothetical protein
MEISINTRAIKEGAITVGICVVCLGLLLLSFYCANSSSEHYLELKRNATFLTFWYGITSILSLISGIVVGTNVYSKL